ncbi:3-deoxy-D-manno-octulosonic acid transferase [Desulfosarcina sp. OttesenSCG-928-A07]|nr:3-deoxy-D-manno-octulosonic acid transferase [Desulfosarcina sp. OttesenSCG-928-G17]MDL2329922.1 3-deoxy-D-manno-octulosonic acid transferase [Desulfosarcina sp. OttesenSCG-928-A07]
MFFYFYNLLMMVVMIIAAPVWIVMGIASQKRRHTLFKRLFMARIRHPHCSAAPFSSPIWIHALSVGEVLSAEPLVIALKKSIGAENLIFTASTRTGFETASQVIFPHVAAIRYFPHDTVFSVLRAFDVIRPKQVIVVETDIWPNFLMLLKHRHIPVCLVNARLSDRSFAGYKRISFLMKPLLSVFDTICAQTEKDRQRFLALGVLAEKLAVPGNLKFDQPAIGGSPQKQDQIREKCRIPKGGFVWVAGSTHPGEEVMLAQAFGLLQTRMREKQSDMNPENLFLVVVPRNPDRAREVANLFQSLKIPAATLMDRESRTRSEISVLVIDRIGLLRDVYAVCHGAFVGGSLVKAGGHNPLEPASAARPVLFGPYVDDFGWIYQELENAGGALCIRSVDTLAKSLEWFLNHPEKAGIMGNAGQAVFFRHQGAVQRTLDIIRPDGKKPE